MVRILIDGCPWHAVHVPLSGNLRWLDELVVLLGLSKRSINGYNVGKRGSLAWALATCGVCHTERGLPVARHIILSVHCCHLSIGVLLHELVASAQRLGSIICGLGHESPVLTVTLLVTYKYTIIILLLAINKMLSHENLVLTSGTIVTSTYIHIVNKLPLLLFRRTILGFDEM